MTSMATLPAHIEGALPGLPDDSDYYHSPSDQEESHARPLQSLSLNELPGNRQAKRTSTDNELDSQRSARAPTPSTRYSSISSPVSATRPEIPEALRRRRSHRGQEISTRQHRKDHNTHEEMQHKTQSSKKRDKLTRNSGPDEQAEASPPLDKSTSPISDSALELLMWVYGAFLKALTWIKPIA
jgi:hypothetical protein